MTRVVVLSDIRLYREGLSAFIAGTNLELVGTACSRAAGLALAAEVNPDVVLLDMVMPESLETVRDLGASLPGAHVVALTVPVVEGDVVACAEAGVAGYVTRDGSLDDLLAAIDGTSRGEVVCSALVTGVLLRRVAALAATQVPRRPEGVLTSRERAVAALIDEGLSNKQIAQRLSIEVATVKNHVHNILEKLQVDRRGEAVARLRAPTQHTP